MRFLIFYITFFIIANCCFGQSNCTENLKKAQNAFESGKIEEIPNLLNKCLENNFNSEQKSLAYKLLTITYLYDKNEEKADDAMLLLLKTDPLFKPDLRNDPSEFISLYNSFRTTPVIITGFSLGSNLFSIRNVSRYGIENLGVESEKYSSKAGIDLGFDLEVPLSKSWSFYSSAHYSNKKYSIFNTLTSFNELEVNENQNWIDLNMMAQFYLRKNGVRPYIRLGGYGGYLLSVRASYLTNQENLNDIEGPSENIKALRNDYNYGLSGDIGVAYSFGRSVIDFTLRITYSLNNYAYEGGRYGDLGNNLALTYGYRDNDLYANIINARLGYKLMIFKPKKLQ